MDLFDRAAVSEKLCRPHYLGEGIVTLLQNVGSQPTITSITKIGSAGSRETGCPIKPLLHRESVTNDVTKHCSGIWPLTLIK